ncbi:MAG: hypothetical protein HY714_03100, partial [Candidatus Omnitrophica bacterium]|nr:hypothetical protein [Candidatus Omnitrophota bacterium]
MKISIPSRRSPFKKLIALITLFCFLLQNTALAMPAGLDRPSSGLSLPPIQIPAGWGSVRASSERRDGPLVIHLEDAHGDYAAQKNIGRIIRHLRDVYGVRLVLAEGAHVRLEPGVFRPFSDRALNLKTADALMRRGEFTGAEKFLLEAEGDPVRRMEAYGIEDPELYRRDFELFVGILGAAEDSAGFAGRMQSRIESAATRVLSPELRAFWREWQKFEATHSGPLRFIGTLRAAARRSLGLDLEDPAQQKRYPSLLRVLKLGELEKKLRPRKIADERKALLRFLDGKIEKRLWRRLRALDVSGLKDSGANPRFLFEKIAEQAGAKGLDFRRYPHYAEFAAYAIFQAEIESQELFLEIRELSDRLFEALAKTEEERGLIALGKDLALVKKLLSLELSRDELQEAAARRQELAPGRLKERLAALEPGLLPDSELAADPLTLRFEEAFEFYRLAEAREKSFADKAAALLHEKKAGRCVLITGGYHTEGLGTLLKERGIAHTIVTPRVGAPEKSHALYLEAMLGKSHIVKGLRLVPERERVRLLGSPVVGRDAALDRS